MTFTGTWKTRGGMIVDVDENHIATTKPDGPQRTFLVDENGDAEAEAGKPYDLMERLSGWDRRR